MPMVYINRSKKFCIYCGCIFTKQIFTYSRNYHGLYIQIRSFLLCYLCPFPFYETGMSLYICRTLYTIRRLYITRQICCQTTFYIYPCFKSCQNHTSFYRYSGSAKNSTKSSNIHFTRYWYPPKPCIFMQTYLQTFYIRCCLPCATYLYLHRTIQKFSQSWKKKIQFTILFLLWYLQILRKSVYNKWIYICVQQILCFVRNVQKLFLFYRWYEMF
uniref:PI226R n=1 Tax=African swine fever virus TaxID=10497 RepID=A0A6G7KU15_ASF